MKQIIKITMALFMLIPLSLFAQTESQHMSFKGVPIDGTLDEFVQQMKQKGFDFVGQQDGIAILKGDFAAYKGCTIGVAALKQRDLVSKISVVFPDCSTWSILSNNYFTLKEMLTEKYGEPAEVVEEFQLYSQLKDDESKFNNVRFDKCKYITIFKTEKGSIQLSIEHDGIYSCYVLLSYFDKINGEIIRTQAMDDL